MYKTTLLLFLSAGVVLLGVFWHLTAPIHTKIIACDVGQGDALLIQHGQFTILVDSGPNQAVLRCFPQETVLLKKKIDVVILTHWDKDHVGGTESLLPQFEVGAWFVNPSTKDTKTAASLVSRLADEERVWYPSPGDELVLPGLRLRFVWNDEVARLASRGKPLENENQSSIGLHITGKSFGFLSLGDLECEQELAVLTLPLLNSYQILKVSHHGAKTSSCLEFLEKMRPEVALISVGEGNKYGHPDPQVLGFLRKMGVFVLRTDRDGRIELGLENGRWRVRRGGLGGVNEQK